MINAIECCVTRTIKNNYIYSISPIFDNVILHIYFCMLKCFDKISIVFCYQMHNNHTAHTCAQKPLHRFNIIQIVLHCQNSYSNKKKFSPSIKHSENRLARQFAATLVECECFRKFRIDFLQLIWNIENVLNISWRKKIRNGNKTVQNENVRRTVGRVNNLCLLNNSLSLFRCEPHSEYLKPSINNYR